MSSPEFLQGGVCSDQGKNPEPKTRTRNLNINVRYVSTWGPEKGIRELLQNFLDGLCTSHKTSGGQSVTPDDYVFAHKVGGGVTFKSWTETWIAKLKEGGKELGSLVWDRKDDKLTAKNENTRIEEKYLYLGPTNKANGESGKHLIGVHGEGMKLGILCLLRDGHRVRYRNADQSWNFHLKKSTASGETVLYMKSRYLDSPSAALSVMICGVTSDVFMLDHYLPFCSNIIREVSSSLCDGGALLEAGDKYEDQGYPGAFLEMYDGYVYVKGIFVVQHDWIHIPVNLLNVSLSRDRGMIADGKEAIRNIAAIWSTVLISEATMLVDVRKYTKLYLDIVQRDFGCYEYRTLKHMDGEVARALLKFIREEVSQNAFPFKKGNAKEAAKIEKCLSKIPYSCTESLYQCLRKSQEVLTVVEAQEAAFCDSSLDTKAIERVLPRVVVGFVEYTMGGDVSVVFKFGAKLTVFLKDGVLMVNSHFLEEGCSPRTALKVLNLIEWEFTKDLGEEERERINLRAKEFIMGTSFRSQIVYPYEKDNGPRNAASQNISREPVENGIGDAVGTNDSNVGNYASPVVESDVQGRNTKIRRIDHVKLLPVEEDSDGSSLKLYEQTTLFLPSVQIDIMHKVLTPCDSNVQDSNVQEVIVGELGELPNNLAISRKNQHRLEMNDGISVVNSDGKNELFRIHVTPRSV